ncbi:hypothetical protein ACLOJK_017605 [Asimina triloba]
MAENEALDSSSSAGTPNPSSLLQAGKPLPHSQLLEASMGLVIISRSLSSSPVSSLSLRRSPPSPAAFRVRRCVAPRRWLKPSTFSRLPILVAVIETLIPCSGCLLIMGNAQTIIDILRSDNFILRCSSKNADIEFNHVATENENQEEQPSSISSGCSIPIVHLSSEILTTEPLTLLTQDAYANSLFTTLPVLSEEEQETLAATPAHPAGLYALYACSLAGNLVEQLWNFAWPAAVALLHPSLLPVAVVGFFTKVYGICSAFICSYDHSCTEQCFSYFGVFIASPTLLAGTNRPIALARANAILSRIDLLCEIAGASLFGILLYKYDPVNCLQLAAGLMIGTLPVVLAAGLMIGTLPVVDVSYTSSPENSVEKVTDAIKHGWNEYRQQPVLPASLAYVLLCFNVVLAPGGLMTAFLTQRGLNPSIIGGFSGLCAFMGVAATFTSASLVKRLGVLKVLSRLGHMSYDVVGAQILQTGIPSSKANVIGATEISMASLAELVMLGVAIIANDVSHFGFLAMLSVSSVVGAAWIYS